MDGKANAWKTFLSFVILAYCLHIIGMFRTMSVFWDSFALITAEIVLSLLLFAAVISLVVFIVRPHVRKFKPLDLAIFDKLTPHTNPYRNRFMVFITFFGKTPVPGTRQPAPDIPVPVFSELHLVFHSSGSNRVE